MPKAKDDHSSEVLCEATGMKQKEFAALVRMGFENYNKVERGSPLTREKAIQISVATGAWPDSLRKPSKLQWSMERTVSILRKIL